MHRNAVFPFDLVSDMIFVARVGRIVEVELFIRVPERYVADGGVETRPTGVATMLMAKTATRLWIDRWMLRRPSLIEYK